MSYPQIVWHYTLGIYIHQIIADGEIHLSDNTKDRPIAWFSANQDWEETARRNLNVNGVRKPLNRIETEKHGKGLYRIGVHPDEANLKPWIRLKRHARLAPSSVYLLEDTAKELGANPFDWWGSLKPVSSEHWVRIEHFADNTWNEMATPLLFVDVK
jgi:hypothetical protein